MKKMDTQNKTPQLENGYTRIANELYEEIMKQPFSGYECRVLHAIIRKTYGYGKKSDYIAFSQISELTGIAKTHISRTMAALIEYKVVTKLGNFTGINKDTSQWAVTKLGNKKKALNVLPKSVSELPKLVMPVTKLGIKKLPKSALQKKKENITKETIQKKVVPFSKIDDLTENDLQEIATRYKVPMAFVMSKKEDMFLWANEKTGRGKGRNWKLTLMNWVKRDAVKMAQEHAKTVNRFRVEKV